MNSKPVLVDDPIATEELSGAIWEEMMINQDWREALQRMLAEKDIGKLKERVFDFEETVYRRYQILNGAADSAEEREEIRRAIEILLKTQTEKLNYPEVKLHTASLPAEALRAAL